MKCVLVTFITVTCTLFREQLITHAWSGDSSEKLYQSIFEMKRTYRLHAKFHLAVTTLKKNTCICKSRFVWFVNCLCPAPLFAE
jgi:hypothetical protein